MSKFNSEVDTYIAKSEDFAKPILEHLRKLIHTTCPAVEEAIKWGFPHLDYKGDFMCVLASYKSHCSLSFIKAELMSDPRLKGKAELPAAKRFMGKLTSLADLPSDAELISMIREAMILNEKGLKVVKPKSEPKVIEVPDYFVIKLETNPKAKEIFESKSSSFRKDYSIWIMDAKTEATREKRMDQALEWIAEGKGRFWQYEK